MHKGSKQRDGGRFTKLMESKKKAGVAILISDKIDFKATKIKRYKEGHYIMVKGSIQQEELTILTPRYIRPIKRLRVGRTQDGAVRTTQD